MATTLYIMRHGETEENVKHILQGILPGQLTQLGRRQARETAQAHLASLHIDALVASDLRRCRQTVDEILPFLPQGLTPIYTPLLREKDWGSATGKVIRPGHPIQLPDDMETMEHTRERAREFLEWAKTHYEGRQVLVVSHGFFLRVMQCVLLGRAMADVVPMQNAEVRTLEIG